MRCQPVHCTTILRTHAVDLSRGQRPEHLLCTSEQVLYRGHGGGADDFQTMSVELPTETLKKLRPKFGKKTFLPIESRLEDNINIPLKVSICFLCASLYSGACTMEHL